MNSNEVSCLSIYLPTYFVHPSIHLSSYPLIHLPIYQSLYNLSYLYLALSCLYFYLIHLSCSSCAYHPSYPICPTYPIYLIYLIDLTHQICPIHAVYLVCLIMKVVLSYLVSSRLILSYLILSDLT